MYCEKKYTVCNYGHLLFFAEMENKLGNIPKIALKRVHKQDNAQASAIATVVKQEYTGDEYNPNEPKTKKGKKSIIKCCIPIQDNGEQETSSGSRMKCYPGRNTDAPSTSFVDKKPQAMQEEIMVDKITDILLKYDFQNKRGAADIAGLIKKVRNMVKKGYVDEVDMSDNLTASIAQVLLPQQISLPMVTNIMCESINNSAEPNAMLGDGDQELITSDPTPSRYYSNQRQYEEPELRTKRKAAIAAEKSIDSLAQDVVINIDDDDDFDARDMDFVPDQDEDADNFKPKKKSKNLTPSNVFDPDESTRSADESEDLRKRINTNFDSLMSTKKPSITTEEEDTSVRKKPGPKKPKDRTIKTYTRPAKKDPPSKPIEDVPTPPVNVSNIAETDYSSILLSDDEEPVLSLKTSEKLAESPKIAPATPDPKIDDEVVPLPMSLLKNQNFINIVAHTYLVGNPMLDEDAATLAAQYSTLKAYKEAEQSGKDVCSGPIYDIAVKVRYLYYLIFCINLNY